MEIIGICFWIYLFLLSIGASKEIARGMLKVSIM